MDKVYIVGAARTPIGKFNGSLSKISAVDLSVISSKAAIERSGLQAKNIDETILGCVLQAGLGQNVARQVSIKCGIPIEKVAMTVNMVCGSGLRSIVSGVQAIKSNDAEVVLAGGTENMSSSPFLLEGFRSGHALGNTELVDSMIKDGLQDVFNNYHMGITAENIASKFNISREEQDIFSLESQKKAIKAIHCGKFKDEIIPVVVPQKKGKSLIIENDEYPREDCSMEALSKLKPAFMADGTVTAGNASGINDGAASVVLASQNAVNNYSLKPLASICSYAAIGCEPEIMGYGPVEAVKLALKKANWNIEEVDLIEANEAFASQAIMVSKELHFDENKVNVNGGAISLGHPIGASGARILVSLLYEMQKRDAKKGLATLCIGGGMGIAMCVER